MEKIMAKLNIKSSTLMKILLGLALGVVVVLAVVFINLSNNQNAFVVASEEPKPATLYEQMEEITETVIQNDTIIVYVSGHVYNPGVFEFYQGARVRDAVEMAGGMTAYADPNAINLASTIFDEQHIVVFGIEDNAPPTASAVIAGQNSGLININRATAEELMTLSGIGSARADAIIRHREARGGFNNIEEIKNVSGIGDSIFGNIRDRITVN